MKSRIKSVNWEMAGVYAIVFAIVFTGVCLWNLFNPNV